MPSGGLRWHLVARPLVLLLLAVGAVALVAGWLLRGLARDEALARVRLTAVGAADAIEHSVEGLDATSGVLQQRPTLVRLLASGDEPAMQRFLEQFRQAARLDGCAVEGPNGRVRIAGQPVDLNALARGGGTSPPADTIHFLFGSTSSDVAEPLLLLRRSARGELPAVAVWRRVDRYAAQDVAPGAEVEVALLGVRETESAIGDARAALRSRALLERRAQAAVLPGSEVLALQPVIENGAVALLVETRLGADSVRAPLRGLLARLGTTALLVTILAAITGAVAARRLGREVDTLTRAAATIQAGNLAPPVPPVETTEIAALGETMDAMRRALLEADAELRRRAAAARAMVDGIVEGVVTVDRDRRVLDLNAQAERLLETTRVAAHGVFCGDLLRPAGEGGSPPCEHSCPILSARDGGPASAVERLQAGGQPNRSVIVTAAAPTEGRQVLLLRDETDVEAARRARDAVLANISHEFRTPLSAQLASLELLLDQFDTLPPAQQRELLQSLHRGALRLTQLIDNLLESVRIESGQTVLRRQSVPLDSVVEEAIESVGPLALLREQTIRFESQAGLPAIEADGARLRQVIVNLLANAQKFAPVGSEIVVRVARDGAQLTVAVEDQGPGWPAGFDAAAVAPFHRGDGQEPEASGVGLGLWIARSIVARHDGELELTTAPGLTVARVRLPIERGPR